MAALRAEGRLRRRGALLAKAGFAGSKNKGAHQGAFAIRVAEGREALGRGPRFAQRPAGERSDPP
jgi:hypothetical protein